MSGFYAVYPSPLGPLLLQADSSGLSGLWFQGGKYCPKNVSTDGWGQCPVLDRTREWLDVYFSGREPDFMPPLRLNGTPFQSAVWDLLRRIPYGATVTYGELAEQLSQSRGLARMSAQAVGGAVGRNPISILVPCHRVVGKSGALTGYAGGLEKKSALLRLEGAV